MGRYKSNASKRQESTALKYVRMRKAMVEIRIALGLDEKAKTEDIVEAVKKLLGKTFKGNLRKEIARLEAALEERGGRGVVLADRIDELRAELNGEEDEEE